jgi:exonuclease III
MYTQPITLHDYQGQRQSVFQYLKKQRASIFFLTETYITKEMVNDINKDWDGPNYHSFGIPHPNGASKGASIFVKKETSFKFLNMKESGDGRKLIINCELENSKFSLIVIYAPNTKTERINFFNDVKCWMREFDLHTIIMGGDFNTIMDKSLDKKGGRQAELGSSKALNKHICNTFDLVDIWRIKNPGKKSFTHKQSNPLVLTRIDFFLVSKSLMTNICSCDIQPSIKSDHRAVTCSFVIKKCK